MWRDAGWFGRLRLLADRRSVGGKPPSGKPQMRICCGFRIGEISGVASLPGSKSERAKKVTTLGDASFM